MDGTYTGVIDRIVDGKTAVVLLEADKETIGQVTVAAEEIPNEYRYESALLEVELNDGELIKTIHCPEEERKRRERVQEKLDRLGEPLDNKRK